jgi:23S rRNA G2069 N7-methylase RlmK/C1962 C5-methylase RlmI
MTTKQANIILNPGREKSLHRHHHWIFSGAIDRASPALSAGETVRVPAADGKPLAVGAVSPQSQIRVHVWSFDPAEEITPPFFTNRLNRALQSRQLLQVGNELSALRLVNAELDGLPALIVDRYEDYLVCQFLSAGADVFQSLRSFRDARRSFDLIILDPPKFAGSGSHMNKAARGYKDINLLAFTLIRPNGVLFTFSCSGRVDPALFQKIVADAALDAGRDAQILEHLEQASDHAVALNFPEGAYLKGLICRVR